MILNVSKYITICSNSVLASPSLGTQKAKALLSVLWLFCFAGGSCAHKQPTIQNIPRRGTVIISP